METIIITFDTLLEKYPLAAKLYEFSPGVAEEDKLRVISLNMSCTPKGDAFDLRKVGQKIVKLCPKKDLHKPYLLLYVASKMVMGGQITRYEDGFDLMAYHVVEALNARYEQEGRNIRLEFGEREKKIMSGIL